ncbi:MAG: hypothetical protein R2778_04040 [Saprospiraceae bacterium]
MLLAGNKLIDFAEHSLPHPNTHCGKCRAYAQHAWWKSCKLDVFIVERAKTARHFVKLEPEKAIQEMTFTEIGQHSSQEEARANV